MNRLLVFFGVLVWFLISVQPTLSNRIIAESTISNVVVYRDRAMIFRQAKLRLPPGDHQILFQHLPATLLTDSLRVRTRAEAVKVLGVRSRIETLREQKESRERLLRNQLRRLQDDLQVLLDEQQTYTEQIEFYRRMGENAGRLVAEELIRSSTSPVDWQNLYRILAKKLTEVRRSVRALEPRKREMEERIAALKEDIAKVEETVSEAYEVTVEVESTASAESEIVLSYVAQGSGWIPLYDVRYLEEEGLLDIAYRALVHQRTGEPWSNVRLTLSTARPLLFGRPKDLTPWTIAFQPGLEPKTTGPAQTKPPETNSSEVTSTESGDNTSKSSDSLFGPKDLGQMDLKQDLKSVAVSFRIPTAETIRSGSSEKKVTITTFQTPARLQYIAIPRQGPYTFLRAIMTNDSTYPLLQGKANIFLGNDFLSTSSIQTTMPNSPLDFYLGTDPEIEVRRTELERKLDSSGLILPTGQQITWRWKLAVINHRSAPIVLEVVDQVPVPQNESIKIEDFRCRDHPYKIEKDGTVRWILNLAPKEDSTIFYSYKIKFPKGTKLSGLEG